MKFLPYLYIVLSAGCSLAGVFVHPAAFVGTLSYLLALSVHPWVSRASAEHARQLTGLENRVVALENLIRAQSFRVPTGR
jgi:hypothetical protein